MQSRFLILTITSAILIFVLSGITEARAFPADSVQPVLRIDTEMHSGPVTSIDIDASSRLALTVSADSTARVWSLPQGHLLRILRAPVRSENEAKWGLDVGALSPDGKIAAVTGSSTHDAIAKTNNILLFNTVTGTVIREIPGIPQQIRALAFSPDGTKLVAAIAFHGISAWHTSNWDLIRSEPEDRSNLIMDMAFSHDGQLATSDLHNTIQTYDSSLRPLSQTDATGPGGGVRQLVLAFSPDGTQLAVGRANSSRIDVFAAKDLSVKFSINPRGSTGAEESSGDVGSTLRLAWSADGRTVYVASLRGDKNAHISAWDASGRGQERIVPIAAPWPITDLKALKSGGFAYVTFGSAWGVADAGSNTFEHPSELPDFRGGQKAFHVSPDGMTVEFGLTRSGNNPVRFSLATRTLSKNMTGSSGNLSPPDASSAMNTNQDAGNFSATTSTRVLNGGPLSFGLYDTSGSKIWYRQSPVPIQMAALSADSRVVVTGNVDGTVRWYRATDGQELLALFVAPDGKHWVLWTPSGYYDAAPGSENLIGWLVGRGPHQAPNFYPASRFADTLRRPDLIAQLLKTFDEGEALRNANAESDRKDKRVTPTVVAARLPPTLTLVYAPTQFNTNSISLDYMIDPNGDVVSGEPRVKVNGEWQPSARAATRGEVNGTHHLTVSGLPPHDSTIEIYADNSHGTSPALVIPLTWNGGAALSSGAQGTASAHKPHLFVLAIGISLYQRSDLKLNFADHDAERFVTAMQAQQGKAYESVETKLIVNGDATRAAVQSGLAWLQGQVKGDDIGILFLAGHGFQTPDQNYFFAPTEFNPDNPRDTGVEYTAIRQALVKFAGAGNKAIFLIDTCYSGGAASSGNLSSSNGELLASSLSQSEYGVAALTAARANQLSFEGSQWEGGAFTKAIMEGIVDEKADPERSGTITFLDLGRYVSKRVPVMTAQRQIPMLIMPTGGFEDYTLATR